jgi:hypothetical protein
MNMTAQRRCTPYCLPDYTQESVSMVGRLCTAKNNIANIYQMTDLIG